MSEQMQRDRPSRRSRRPPASDRVRGEWLRRIEAEYRSAAITQHLTLWLIQIGASPDLVSDGLRIVGDEMKHAELSHVVYQAARGEEQPHIDRNTLQLPRSQEPLEIDVLRAGVDIFCLGETVAVRLFKVLREGCTVAPARKALDRVLKDEVRHRDFGWTLLGWLLDTPLADQLRTVTQQELPGMFRRIRSAYAFPMARSELEIDPADRAWGLMPSGLYAEILEQTLQRDYTPRFEELGIDAQRAWRASDA